MAWIGSRGLIATRVGTSDVLTTRLGEARFFGPGVTHKLALQSADGLPLCVAVAGDMLWLDYFTKSPFGGFRLYSRVTSHSSAQEFADGRIANVPEPVRPNSVAPVQPPPPVGGPIWFRTESETGAVLIRRDDRDEWVEAIGSALVPVSATECLRFDLGEHADTGARILVCTRLSKRVGPPLANTPPETPLIEVLGQVAVPFGEKFSVTTARGDYQFVTESGRLYTARRGKTGLPGDFRRYDARKGVRVLGVVTDTRTGRVFVFAKAVNDGMEFRPLGEEAKPVTLQAMKAENHADTLGAAEAMYSALVNNKAIIAVEPARPKP